MKSLLLILCLSLSTFSFAGDRDKIKSSLLLLIDSSGSMGDMVGNGNPEVKIEAARAAAIEAVNKATQRGLVEVAVLAFEGDCSNPIAKHLNFTTDENKLINFISQIQPAGGTPMADAVLAANNFMQNNGKPNALTQMIVLLADGQNDCGDVKQAMATLQASGAIFRHETVGFGIAPNSSASADLRYIANASGGTYHHAQNAVQLGDAFDSILDTFTVIDLMGQFTQHGMSGKNKALPQKPKSNKKSSISLNLLGNIFANKKHNNQKTAKPANSSLGIGSFSMPSATTIKPATNKWVKSASANNCITREFREFYGNYRNVSLLVNKCNFSVVVAYCNKYKDCNTGSSSFVYPLHIYNKNNVGLYDNEKATHFPNSEKLNGYGNGNINQFNSISLGENAKKVSFFACKNLKGKKIRIAHNVKGGTNFSCGYQTFDSFETSNPKPQKGIR